MTYRAPITRSVVRTQKPLVTLDVYDNTSLAKAFRQSAGNRPHGTLSGTRCWEGIPMVPRNECMVLNAFGYSSAGHLSPDHESALIPIANEAAAAIDHASAPVFTQATDTRGTAIVDESEDMATAGIFCIMNDTVSGPSGRSSGGALQRYSCHYAGSDESLMVEMCIRPRDPLMPLGHRLQNARPE